MNEIIKHKGVFRLADAVSYEEGKIKRVVIEENDKMRFFVMAFDKDQLLAEHKAPGNAIITVLEGRAAIRYNGKEYIMTKGDNFVFLKDELHSVYAPEQMKVSLLLDMA